MSILTLPAGLRIARLDWGQQRYDQRFEDGDTGAGQTRVLAPPRWTVGLVCPAHLTREQAAVWRSLVLRLQGRVHQLAVHDMDNPVPRGTLRGMPTLGAAAAAGATSLYIVAGLGATLLEGDWIGVGSGLTRQLLSVAADAAADGVGNLTVAVSQPLRWPLAIGAAVLWDRPTALFRQATSDSSWTFERQVRTGYSLDLVESWEA